MRALHVAIIMDGNGRWARGRGHARFFGHIRGAERVREVVTEAATIGLGALTLYAFSTENWKRPEAERTVLWKILHRYLKREVPELRHQNVRLRIIGDRSRLSPELVHAIDAAERALECCSGLQLNVAISYGARDEIVRAARAYAKSCLNGHGSPEELTEKQFSELLDTGSLGPLSDVDLVLRTSGESRLSNFMLWQAAYAELVFVEKSWPEFSAEDLSAAVRDFSSRDRRFGGIDVSTRPKVPGAPEAMR
jgi:undecaprenyl diphosphate synthase